MECPETALWRAVVQQAITDAQMVIEDLPPWPEKPRNKLTKQEKTARARLSHKYKRNRDERNARDEARKWIREAGLDFHRVCDMAAIEPEYAARKLAA